jgi:hypothetical protein
MMSFGFTNAPVYFMYLMNKVFMEFVDKFIIVFMNDKLVRTRMKKNTKNISI